MPRSGDRKEDVAVSGGWRVREWHSHWNKVWNSCLNLICGKEPIKLLKTDISHVRFCCWKDKSNSKIQSDWWNQRKLYRRGHTASTNDEVSH